MTDLNKVIRDEIEQSELTKDDAIKGGVRKHRNAGAVYSVRLPAEIRDEIDALAKDLDVPSSALVRGFVLDGLAARQRHTLRGLIDQLDSDLRKLKELL